MMKAYAYCLIAVLLGTTVAWGQERGALRDRTEAEEGVEVLTRGPVHEAFAGTVTFDPQAGIVVPNAPPDVIEELPPEQRLKGDNVAWIPGYWAWDDERNDFLWVSGIWRNLPPGRQWVPGYWGQSGTDYQWTSGYWADAAASEIEYLPEPPASVEQGPNVAASSPDQSWLPGCWIWQQTRYAWRPGYWATVQPNWVWVPSYYTWAPRGYVFVDGYWDYSVARRGVLFAPVYFSSSIYSRRGYSYSPLTVINPAVFASQLFLRPNYQHYYFGDYYGASYATVGFYPWFSYNSLNRGYDPIYAHEHWQHRQDRDWEQQVQANFQHRRDHEEARPPRTWEAQRSLVASQVNSKTDNSFVMAAPLAQLVTSNDSPLRFQPVAEEERQTLIKHGNEIREFRQQRQKLEAQAAVTSAADPSKQPEPARVKFPESPIVARQSDLLGRNEAPPKRHEVLKPNLQIEPRPKRQPQPQPEVGRPLPQLQPQPKVGRPAPQPKVQRPERQPQPQPEVGRPLPQLQPQPKVGRPAPQPQPQPKVQRPEPQPQPQPEVGRPLPQLQPQPKVGRPAPQPQPQPKVQRPEPQPQPQPKVERPEPQPQPQPKVQRPAPQPQPQPKVERPEPQPQPQPKVQRPAPQPQPQPKVQRPAPQPQPQPKVQRPAPQPKVQQPAPAPPAQQPPPKQDNGKEKGNGKGKKK